jgi:hypothetical protein
LVGNGEQKRIGFRDRLIFPELLDQDIRLISIGVAAKIARVPSRTAIRLDGAIREGSSRLDHASVISVLENDALALLCLSQHNIHHCPGQVIGANHLVREQHPKNGIDRAKSVGS